MAAIGPDRMRGSDAKATNIENCVAVYRLSTRRMISATRAVVPIPAAILSLTTATANNDRF